MPINNQAEITAGLQTKRNEQRALASKMTELQMDLNEHKLVCEALKDADKDRRCFRSVGGVLVEHTAGSVYPALLHNMEKMETLIKTLEKQLEEKGREINAYIEKHNILVM